MTKLTNLKTRGKPHKARARAADPQPQEKAASAVKSDFLKMPQLQPLPVAAAAPLSEAEIAQRAYLYHEMHGACHGRDLDDWLAAESSLLAEREQQPH